VETCRCRRVNGGHSHTSSFYGLFGFNFLRRPFEASGSDKNPDSHRVADSSRLVVTNKAASLRHRENAMRFCI
jgi:hypothetical protein